MKYDFKGFPINTCTGLKSKMYHSVFDDNTDVNTTKGVHFSIEVNEYDVKIFLKIL